MKSRTLYISIVAGGLIVAAVFFVYPVFKGEAQDAPQQLKKVDENALVKLRGNAVATIFYDKLSSEESGLVLVRFAPPSTMENHKVINMVFRKEDKEVYVSILEYQSAEDAQSTLQGIINSVNGDVKPYKDYGDEGITIYGYRGKGGLTGLAYRKNRFYVSIYCQDEALAKRLAGYAYETISR